MDFAATHQPPRTARRLLHGALVAAGAVAFTLACFLLLPLIQAIADVTTPDLQLQSMSAADVPPPPPPPEEKQKEEEKPEEPKPEVDEPPQRLDLSQLENVLNPGSGGGWMGGDFGVKLQSLGVRRDESARSFSLADLDQAPRIRYERLPNLSPDLVKRTPATVVVLFDVNEQGRVENAVVQTTTDPAFDRPTLAAVQRWTFEPGKKEGEPVRFRMRRTITFPKK